VKNASPPFILGKQDGDETLTHTLQMSWYNVNVEWISMFKRPRAEKNMTWGL
jgi:hypothetical protein